MVERHEEYFTADVRQLGQDVPFAAAHHDGRFQQRVQFPLSDAVAHFQKTALVFFCVCVCPRHKHAHTFFISTKTRGGGGGGGVCGNK